MRRELLCASLVAMTLMLATASLAASDIYEVEPTFSPYSAGVVERSVLEEASREVNYVRALAGVPSDVTLDDGFITKAQHGAVLMDATDVMSHTPTRPVRRIRGLASPGPSAPRCCMSTSRWAPADL